MRKFEAIRAEIKTLSQSQIDWKIKRSKGEGQHAGLLMEVPSYVIQKNKYELRHLFQAYAILKGIDRPEVKKPSNYNGVILDEKKVQELVEKFKPVEVLEDAVASQ